MIFGTEITKDMVEADPDWPRDKKATDADLGAFTQKLQNKYEQSATQWVNGTKQEYGNGISTLVMIYNATGSPVRYQDFHDWSGHIWKYNTDEVILNGQWSVFLHVHTSGTMCGSVAAVIYRVEGQDCDLFLGWDNPYSGNNGVYVEAREKGHWPGVGSWDYMEGKLDSAGAKDESSSMGREIYASVGSASSPIARYLLA